MSKSALLTLTIGVSLSALPLAAQSLDLDDDDKKKGRRDQSINTLDQVIVTGTRVSNRTVAESISPIDIITAEALDSTGTTELATALERLVPSLTFRRPYLNDGTDTIRPAQIRGLSPDHVLVLINGKRRHTSAIVNVNGSQGRGSSPVDLNAIPVAAIERIEVLRDGAAAQYGSDAIAGVINVILKGGGEGGSLGYKYGKYSAGDGAQNDVSGDVGFKFGGTGWVRLAGQFVNAEPTNRASPDYTLATTDPRYGKINYRYGDPKTRNLKLFANSEYDLDNGVQLYGFANYSDRNGEAAANFRSSTSVNNVTAIYPEGFLPLILTTSKDRSLVLGARGTSGDWRWDLSGNYGSNTLEFNVANSLNATLGSASPTRFYAGQLQKTQALLNADVARDFDWGLAGPATLAFGAEYKREGYAIGAGEQASWIRGDYGSTSTGSGSQGFPGFQPSDAGSHHRHSHALYAELDADLTEKLGGSLAARYEDYSDFGDTVSGKLALRYAFTDTFSARATVSNGFRAPSLAQQWYSTTSATYIGGQFYDIRTFPVNTAAAKALGATALKPEKSVNYSLGLVWQPLAGLSVTVDFYQVDIDDRIVLSENLTNSAARALLTSLGYIGVGGGRYFTNAIDTRTRGADLVGAYRFELGPGWLGLSLAYNYNKTELVREHPNAPEIEALGFDRISRVEIGRITKGTPHDKASFNADYQVGDWSIRAGVTRYGRFTSYVSDSVLAAGTGADQTYGVKYLTDVAADYRLGRWTFTLGADNVLDVYPDESSPENWSSPLGPLYKYQASQFGANGRFVYARAGYRW
ncbi:MAG: TonB-dependent receptor [Pseudomonas sp.]